MARVTLILPLLLMLAGSASARNLEIFFIDVEGGQATLIVTPAGQSLLIDAGYAGRDARDAERIMAAVREAHVDHIDYLLITHFHNDHVGGVPELADRIPILRFVDYGEPLGTDRMATNGFRVYEPVRGENVHLVPRPGDRLALDGVAADMIVMEVCNQQVIDVIDVSLANRSHNPLGIASVAPGVSGIDQQRLSRGRHDERRLPAFDVDKENFEVPGGSQARRSGRQHEEYEKDESAPAHESLTIHSRRPRRQWGPELAAGPHWLAFRSFLLFF